MDTLQRDLNALCEADKNKRRTSLERIKKLVEDPSATIDSPTLVAVTRSIVRTFEDKSERCRELAIQIALEVTPRQDATVMDWLLPSVVARIGIEPVTEESEELRLMLLRLATLCLDTFPNDIGPKNYVDYFKVLLENCLKDPFPSLKRAACSTTIRLCQVEPKRVRALALPLAKAVKNHCLQHKHSVVRVDAVECFARLIASGAVEILGDMRDEQDNRTSVHYLYVLSNDHSEGRPYGSAEPVEQNADGHPRKA